MREVSGWRIEIGIAEDPASLHCCWAAENEPTTPKGAFPSPLPLLYGRRVFVQTASHLPVPVFPHSTASSSFSIEQALSHTSTRVECRFRFRRRILSLPYRGRKTAVTVIVVVVAIVRTGRGCTSGITDKARASGVRAVIRAGNATIAAIVDVRVAGHWERPRPNRRTTRADELRGEDEEKESEIPSHHGSS